MKLVEVLEKANEINNRIKNLKHFVHCLKNISGIVNSEKNSEMLKNILDMNEKDKEFLINQIEKQIIELSFADLENI